MVLKVKLRTQAGPSKPRLRFRASISGPEAKGKGQSGKASNLPFAYSLPWFLAVPTQSGKRRKPGILVASTKRQPNTSLRIGKRLSSDKSSHWFLRELEISKRQHLEKTSAGT